MKKLFKKRQLVLVALVLALGAAVFINWYYSNPAVVTDGQVLQSTTAATANQGSGRDDSQNEHLGDSQYVHNPYSTMAGEYFAGAKLRRATAHGEAKDTLNGVITDSKANAKAVAEASKALQQLANAIKLEADCESLITAKTGSECLVMIGEEAVEAVLGGEAIDGTTALRIKEILMDKTGVDGDQISIVELN